MSIRGILSDIFSDSSTGIAGKTLRELFGDLEGSDMAKATKNQIADSMLAGNLDDVASLLQQSPVISRSWSNGALGSDGVLGRVGERHLANQPEFVATSLPKDIPTSFGHYAPTRTVGIIDPEAAVRNKMWFNHEDTGFVPRGGQSLSDIYSKGQVASRKQLQDYLWDSEQISQPRKPGASRYNTDDIFYGEGNMRLNNRDLSAAFSQDGRIGKQADLRGSVTSKDPTQGMRNIETAVVDHIMDKLRGIKSKPDMIRQLNRYLPALAALGGGGLLSSLLTTSQSSQNESVI